MHDIKIEVTNQGVPFQQRVYKWCKYVWPVEAMDKLNPVRLQGIIRKRLLRFGEEAIELLQAGGLDEETVIMIVKYVYGRPRGEVKLEVGGTLITLTLLCEYMGYSLMQCGEDELTRIATKIREIRNRDAGKPTFNTETYTPPNAGDSDADNSYNTRHKIECCLRSTLDMLESVRRLYIPESDTTFTNVEVFISKARDSLPKSK